MVLLHISRTVSMMLALPVEGPHIESLHLIYGAKLKGTENKNYVAIVSILLLNFIFCLRFFRMRLSRLMEMKIQLVFHTPVRSLTQIIRERLQA